MKYITKISGSPNTTLMVTRNASLKKEKKKKDRKKERIARLIRLYSVVLSNVD